MWSSAGFGRQRAIFSDAHSITVARLNMVVRTFKSLSAWSRRQINKAAGFGLQKISTLEPDPRSLTPASQRLAVRIAALPIGRRFPRRPGKLGLQQRWYTAQPTQRIVISVLELRAPVSRESIGLAVRAMCARHPSALGVCVERSRRRLCLRPLTAADPVPWFDPADRDLWTLAAAMLHCTFSLDAPLFRIALTPDGRHVLAAFDHLIADGVSAGIFAAELGSFLAGDALLPVAADAALPLDARLDLRPSVGVLARAIGQAAAKDLLLTPNPLPANLHELRTQILARAFSRDLVDALIGAARLRAVTLHAVMSSAALLAAIDALDVNRGTLRLTTPITVREQCRPKPDGIGVFIAGIDLELEVSASDDPWLVALRYRDAIGPRRPDAHRTVGLLALAGDLEALATKYEQTAHGRTATVEVSNVGRVIGVPHGAAVWLTQGAHYHAALFVLTVATSDSDGALRCCLSYAEPLIDRERADHFMRAFERQLVEMRESSSNAVDA
jgi:hypothetical protein